MQVNRKILLPEHGAHARSVDMPEVELPPKAPQRALAGDTAVQTAMGVRRVEALTVGARVLTRSGDYATVTGTQRTTFTHRQLHDTPDAAPIRFDPGALPGMPEGPAILLSPDCPVAWDDDPSGIDRFPARAFCDGGLIRRVLPDEGITYVSLSFETATQVSAGGVWVELGPEDADAPDGHLHIPKLVHNIRIFRPMRA